MKVRIRTLASGSNGNALLAEFGETRLLLDAGIPGSALKELLEEEKIAPADLDAILLTHEHIDHCRGLAQIMRMSNMPVYASRGSFEGLEKHSFFKRLPKERFQLFRAGDSFSLGPLRIQSLPISHDTLEPVAYRLETGGYAFASVTDLGCAGPELAGALQGLNSLLLEANHDRRILEAGPYPYRLKLRIDSDQGHLSNEAAGRLLQQLYHPGLEQVMLGHLSQTNNYPPLALDTVAAALKELGPETDRVQLHLAPVSGFSESLGREI